MNNREYARMSLELHLFFDRIMKEHSLFLELAFLDKNNNLKLVAKNFQESFDSILKRIIVLANGNINQEFLNSMEMITKDTLLAEKKTSNLTGSFIDLEITNLESRLRSGMIKDDFNLINNIRLINRETLELIPRLIDFKKDILEQVLTCKMYTTNYPLLLEHIVDEAKMYYTLLSKIEKKEIFTRNELYQQELFWNDIMEEHAKFIRGLLDPSEENLIKIANKYAIEYQQILKNNTISNLTNISLDETIRFRDFKIAALEGILDCKIKSIISPLLSDHVLREANHFIRILKSINIYRT